MCWNSGFPNLYNYIYLKQYSIAGERKRPARLLKPDRSLKISETELSKFSLDYTRFSLIERYEYWTKALKIFPGE
jgi:hypothetical protein